MKLTIACNPMFPPEDTKLHPLVLYCVGTIQDGDEPVGMITGIWFRMGLWEDMPDEDQPWYFAPFMAVSADTFVMADFIALSGPEIRRDVSRSDKLDIFFIDCVWVEPAHRGRGIAPDCLAALVASCRDSVGVFTCDAWVIRMAPDGVLEIASPFARDCDKSEYYNEKARAERVLCRAGFAHIPEDFQHTWAADPTAAPVRPGVDRVEVEFVQGPAAPIHPLRWHSKRKTT